MSIITLTSDWGHTDHYLAAVKGAILRRLPGAIIVDISHNIRHYDIRQASFIVRESYRQFPEGTVHILAIESIESLKQPHVVVKVGGHYFIGADNGLISLILDNDPERIISLQVPQDTGFFTFPERDRFAKVACHLAEGKSMEELGEPLEKLNVKLHMKAIIDKDIIHARVMYVDDFENAFINVTEQEFRSAMANRPFTISFRRHRIRHIVKAYEDVPEGEMCALFSTSGYLEIAMNHSTASSLLGLALDTNVNISFGEQEKQGGTLFK